MNSERRTAKRIEFKSTARIYCDSDKVLKLNLETENISLKGIFLTTAQDIPAGTECTVEVDLAGSTSTMHFTVAGVVTRKETDGVAISFTDLTPDGYAHIQNLLLLQDKIHKD